MTWSKRAVRVGDMIRVPMGPMFHFGVCTAENRIIQFGEPSLTTRQNHADIRVQAVTLSHFSKTHTPEVADFSAAERARLKPVDDIIAEAERRLGEGGYDILYNNCEHFASECLFGEHKSFQVDDVREEIERKMPSIFVSVNPLSDVAPSALPPFLEEELDRIQNEDVRREKLCAYALLEELFFRFFPAEDFTALSKNRDGKPVHPALFVSLSHAHDLCAAAVSRAPVGLDLEREIAPERKERIRRGVLHENESEDLDLSVLWTKKEAIFKVEGKGSFFAKNVDTTAHKTTTFALQHAETPYFLSVSAACLLALKPTGELLQGATKLK